MVDYFTSIATELGVSLWLFAVIIVWDLVWKILAMWKAARKGSPIWFVMLMVFNTVGILPILYIYVFSKMKCCEAKKAKRRKRR